MKKDPRIALDRLVSSFQASRNNRGADEIKKGKRLEVGREYSGFIEGFNVTFREMAKRPYEEYLGYAIWFYKSYDFPVIQCVWPTTKGYSPWDNKYPKDLVEWQPLLDK